MPKECLQFIIYTLGGDMDTNLNILFSSSGWDNLKDSRKLIKKFLKSVDVKIIGTNLVDFDNKQFILRPTWSGVQEGYERTQQGLLLLNNKIDFLLKQIEIFSPEKKENCPVNAKKFMCKLLDIQYIINSVAKNGWEQICQNYTNVKKINESQCLNSFRKEVFEKIDDLIMKLFTKTIKYFPALQKDLNLNKFHFATAPYFRKREEYLQNLRDVEWIDNKGVIIPQSLLVDCFKNLGNSYSKGELKNGANLIELPSMAVSILTQNKSAKWIPIRSTDIDVGVEKGINGCCERDSIGDINLYNVYYRKNDNGRVVISTGAVNTEAKAKQLVQIITEIMKNIKKIEGDSKKNNERWVVHQLNSFFTNEDTLISEVHTQVAFVEFLLKKENEDISMLHINTAFNSATKWSSSEHNKSVQGINIDSLALFSEYASKDLTELMNEFYQLKSDELNNFKIIVGKVVLLSKEIKMLKNQTNKEKNLNKNKTKNDRVKCEKVQEFSDEKNLQINEVVNLKKNDNECDEQKISENIVDNKLKISNCDSFVDVNIEESLIKKQMELQNNLSELIHLGELAIENLKTSSVGLNDQWRIDKSLLILEVLMKIISLQVKPKSTSLSRCSEIELFLLLYRLLDIKVIVSCWSGLDRTGAVAAFDDSLTQLEMDLKERYLIELKNYNNLKIENLPMIAQQKSFEMLYDLIIEMDANRQELFKLGNSLIKTNKLNIVKELNEECLKQMKKDRKDKKNENLDESEIINFRGLLIEEIRKFKECEDKENDQKIELSINNEKEENIDNYKKNNFNEKNFKIEIDLNVNKLELTLYYLELFAKHLLGSRQEIAFFSTGVFGLKYHYDSYLSFFSANPHPLERLPQFIFTSDPQPKIIQLLDYYPTNFFTSWLYNNSIKITKVGISLFERLGKLRGK